MKTISLVLLLLGSTSLYAEVHPYLKKLGLSMNNILTTSCEDRIFKGHDWKDKYIIVSDMNGKQAFELQIGREEIVELDITKLPNEGNLYYQFGTYKGEKATYVGLTARFLELFLHESFHHFSQGKPGWYTPQGRGVSYPIKGTPRFYRNLVARLLRLAFLDDNAEALSVAKFYHEKWKTEYPSEYLASMDSIEGSAQYFYHMVKAVLTLGCKASDQQLKDHFKVNFQDYFRPLSAPTVKGDRSTDYEYYDLGSLAAIILKFQGNQDWVRKISEEKANILDVLFEGVKPLQMAQFPQQLFDLYSQFERDYNDYLAPALNGFDRKIMGLDYVRVEYPLDGYNPFFFGRTMNTNIIVLSGKQDDQWERSYFSAENYATLVDLKDHPCKQRSFTQFILIHKDEFERIQLDQEEKLVINSSQGKGEVFGKMFEKNNNSYFCLNDQEKNK